MRTVKGLNCGFVVKEKARSVGRRSGSSALKPTRCRAVKIQDDLELRNWFAVLKNKKEM